MKKYRKKIILLGLMASMAVFAGCSKDEEPETVKEEAVVEPTVEEEEVLKLIGTEEADALKIRLKNSTGMDIKSVSIKKIEETEFPENMLEENDVYVIDEERYLYYKIEEQETQEDAAAGEEKLLTEGYDIQLTFEDDTAAVLHAFPMEDIEEGEIFFEEGVAYLKYESMSTKELVETKEAELAVKAQEEAEAQRLAEEAEAQRLAEEAEAQRLAEEAEAQRLAEEAQRQAEQAAQYDGYNDDYDYNDNYSSGSGSSSNSSSTDYSDSSSSENTGSSGGDADNGSFSDNGCLDGGLLY